MAASFSTLGRVDGIRDLCAAAFVPAAPLLVPAVASGAATELDTVRDACRRAVGRLGAAGADTIVMLADGPVDHSYPPGAAGALAGFGVDVRVGAGEPVLPPRLTVLRWLLEDAGWAGPVLARTVGPGSPAAGNGLAPVPTGRWAALVHVEGSARGSAQAPGYLDPRADGYDARLAAAIAAADTGLLAGWDTALAGALLAPGAWSLRRLAAAVASVDRPGAWAGRLVTAQAPYGVGYLVVVWERQAVVMVPGS